MGSVDLVSPAAKKANVRLPDEPAATRCRHRCRSAHARCRQTGRRRDRHASPQLRSIEIYCPVAGTMSVRATPSTVRKQLRAQAISAFSGGGRPGACRAVAGARRVAPRRPRLPISITVSPWRSDGIFALRSGRRRCCGAPAGRPPGRTRHHAGAGGDLSLANLRFVVRVARNTAAPQSSSIFSSASNVR